MTYGLQWCHLPHAVMQLLGVLSGEWKLIYFYGLPGYDCSLFHFLYLRYLSIHPSIHLIYTLHPIQDCLGLGPIPPVIGWEAGYIEYIQTCKRDLNQEPSSCEVKLETTTPLCSPEPWLKRNDKLQVLVVALKQSIFQTVQLSSPFNDNNNNNKTVFSLELLCTSTFISHFWQICNSPLKVNTQ